MTLLPSRHSLFFLSLSFSCFSYASLAQLETTYNDLCVRVWNTEKTLQETRALITHTQHTVTTKQEVQELHEKSAHFYENLAVGTFASGIFLAVCARKFLPVVISTAPVVYFLNASQKERSDALTSHSHLSVLEKQVHESQNRHTPCCLEQEKLLIKLRTDRDRAAQQLRKALEKNIENFS